MTTPITAGGLLGSLFGGHGSGQSGYGPSPGYGGGYGQPIYVQQNKPKRGGLGAGGGAALGDCLITLRPKSSSHSIFPFLGLGAGLVGGLLLEDAIDDAREDGYEQGYDQGYDNGGDFGGDDGGF
jgi:hypothetical protein